MIFHENCLLADNSNEISYLIFFRKLGKMSQNLSSAAVVIGVLRVSGILPPSAPALPSRVTCQVNESPRTFSDSSSLIDLGNAFLHNSNILGRCPFTTGGPLKTNKK